MRKSADQLATILVCAALCAQSDVSGSATAQPDPFSHRTSEQTLFDEQVLEIPEVDFMHPLTVAGRARAQQVRLLAELGRRWQERMSLPSILNEPAILEILLRVPFRNAEDIQRLVGGPVDLAKIVLESVQSVLSATPSEGDLAEMDPVFTAWFPFFLKREEHRMVDKTPAILVTLQVLGGEIARESPDDAARVDKMIEDILEASRNGLQCLCWFGSPLYVVNHPMHRPPQNSEWPQPAPVRIREDFIEEFARWMVHLQWRQSIPYPASRDLIQGAKALVKGQMIQAAQEYEDLRNNESTFSQIQRLGTLFRKFRPLFASGAKLSTEDTREFEDVVRRLTVLNLQLESRATARMFRYLKTQGYSQAVILQLLEARASAKDNDPIRQTLLRVARLWTEVKGRRKIDETSMQLEIADLLFPAESIQTFLLSDWDAASVVAFARRSDPSLTFLRSQRSADASNERSYPSLASLSKFDVLVPASRPIQSIRTFHMPEALALAFEQAGIQRVSDLSELTAAQALAIPEVGYEGLDWLQAQGVTLKPEIQKKGLGPLTEKVIESLRGDFSEDWSAKGFSLQLEKDRSFEDSVVRGMRGEIFLRLEIKLNQPKVGFHRRVLVSFYEKEGGLSPQRLLIESEGPSFQGWIDTTGLYPDRALEDAIFRRAKIFRSYRRGEIQNILESPRLLALGLGQCVRPGENHLYVLTEAEHSPHRLFREGRSGMLFMDVSRLQTAEPTHREGWKQRERQRARWREMISDPSIRPLVDSAPEPGNSGPVFVAGLPRPLKLMATRLVDLLHRKPAISLSLGKSINGMGRIEKLDLYTLLPDIDTAALKDLGISIEGWQDHPSRYHVWVARDSQGVIEAALTSVQNNAYPGEITIEHVRLSEWAQKQDEKLMEELVRLAVEDLSGAGVERLVASPVTRDDFLHKILTEELPRRFQFKENRYLPNSYGLTFRKPKPRGSSGHRVAPAAALELSRGSA